MKKLKKLIYLKFARSLNKNNSGSPVPTIISENTRVNGDIISSATLHIDGHVEGDITCDELIIGVRGSVEGSVTAKTLQLYGTLSGKAAAEKILLPNRPNCWVMRPIPQSPLSPVLILTGAVCASEIRFRRKPPSPSCC